MAPSDEQPASAGRETTALKETRDAALSEDATSHLNKSMTQAFDRIPARGQGKQPLRQSKSSVLNLGVGRTRTT